MCLYNGNNCISSIELTYEGNGMMAIDSKTREINRGKKYNKLLRSVIIIVSSLIICHENKIIKIGSRAVNPISAWLLINYFNTTYESDRPKKLETYLETHSPITDRKSLNEFYEMHKSCDLNITVELNAENIRKANELFDNLTSNNPNSIKCL